MRAAAASPSRRACSSSRDKSLRVWDAVTGRCLFSLHGHKAPVTCVRWGGAEILEVSVEGGCLADGKTVDATRTMARTRPVDPVDGHALVSRRGLDDGGRRPRAARPARHPG